MSAAKTWSHAARVYSEKQIIVRTYCFGSATSDVSQKYAEVLYKKRSFINVIGSKTGKELCPKIHEQTYRKAPGGYNIDKIHYVPKMVHWAF